MTLQKGNSLSPLSTQSVLIHSTRKSSVSDSPGVKMYNDCAASFRYLKGADNRPRTQAPRHQLLEVPDQIFRLYSPSSWNIEETDHWRNPQVGGQRGLNRYFGVFEDCIMSSENNVQKEIKEGDYYEMYISITSLFGRLSSLKNFFWTIRSNEESYRLENPDTSYRWQMFPRQPK